MALSPRATQACSPSLPYFSLFMQALSNLHSPGTNPNGIVSLCVAENALSAPLLAHRLRTAASLSPPPPGQLGYDDMRGRAPLRDAFARLAASRITRGAPVAPRHLTVAGGCGALIQHLAFLLVDPALACMILVTPTYAMLYNDVGVLAGVRVVDAPLAPGAPLSAALLDAASASARAQGLTPKLLFLINPDNPLGVVRPAAEVRAALAWARAQEGGMHVVVDEIYALSVHGGEGAGFTSAATLMHGEGGGALRAGGGAGSGEGDGRYLGDFVHILWGLSKDWCASGLRVGLLLTHNEALTAALDNVGYFSAASNATQDALAEVLADGPWVEGFLARNLAALAGASRTACAALERARIPFLRPSGGMFVWVDLRAWLPGGGARGWGAERELTGALFQAGVLLTPGEAMHAAEPGFFRLCFAWHAELGSLEEGLRRLAAFCCARGEGGAQQ